MATVQIQGREYSYAVALNASGEPRKLQGRVIYEVVGRRGARYLAVRIHADLNVMFLHPATGALGRVRLTDADGTLREIECRVAE